MQYLRAGISAAFGNAAKAVVFAKPLSLDKVKPVEAGEPAVDHAKFSLSNDIILALPRLVASTQKTMPPFNDPLSAITCPTANSELKSPLCVIVTSCLGAFAPLPAVTVAVVTRLELFRLGDKVQK